MIDPPFNVLHISYSDNKGGSARSAYRIHNGLREIGVISRMLVAERGTEDPTVKRIHGGRLLIRILDMLGARVVDRIGLQYLFYPSSFAALRHPWLRQADIVQLYNTHGGWFTHRVLPSLTHGRTVVWRLSDMWPLTGHCAYSYDCGRWETGCGECPLLGEYPRLNLDTTALLWRIKKRLYHRSQLVLVATNSWMAELVDRSPLLGQFPVHIIPNGVDTKAFRPVDTGLARERLQLPLDTRIVLWIAEIARPNTRKGGEYVVPIMERIAAKIDTYLILVVVGKKSEAWPEGKGFKTVRLDYIDGNDRLANVYSAADVLLLPAVAENLPSAVLESMACGTPVAAFDTGGIGDIVKPPETGLIAPRKDTEQLAAYVFRLLEDDTLRLDMAHRCRNTIEVQYTTKQQTLSYLNLYEDLLAESQPSRTAKHNT